MREPEYTEGFLIKINLTYKDLNYFLTACSFDTRNKLDSFVFNDFLKPA